MNVTVSSVSTIADIMFCKLSSLPVSYQLTVGEYEMHQVLCYDESDNYDPSKMHQIHVNSEPVI